VFYFSHHPALWAPLLGQEGSFLRHRELGSGVSPALLLPEEEYPEGGRWWEHVNRWWEKAPIGGGRKSFQIHS